MNLKTKTAVDSRLSRVVHGPTNLTAPSNIEVSEDNKGKFVNDWATFSQALLWIIQNSTDYNCANVALEALRGSELIDSRTDDGGDDDEQVA